MRVRGKLQSQILCGADDYPRGLINTGHQQMGDKALLKPGVKTDANVQSLEFEFRTIIGDLPYFGFDVIELCFK